MTTVATDTSRQPEPSAREDGSGRLSDGPSVGDPERRPLQLLPGVWTGAGFNQIWRPHHRLGHFLQLNLTSETLTFNSIGGPVPNRGLDQPDIDLHGVRYLQQIHDNSGFPPPDGGGALHLEPGFFLEVPPTTAPRRGMTIARLASIPHGTTVLLEGTAELTEGKPDIPATSITPFTIGSPADEAPFPESDLSVRTRQRNAPLPEGINQRLVDDPNRFLRRILTRQDVVSTMTLSLRTRKGAGVDNIAFLGRNASVSDVRSTFWIETIANPDGSTFRQLQYTQRLVLDFSGLSWPHVSVGSLVLTGA
jgi:hypothetical protein